MKNTSLILFACMAWSINAVTITSLSADESVTTPGAEVDSQSASDPDDASADGLSDEKDPDEKPKRPAKPRKKTKPTKRPKQTNKDKAKEKDKAKQKEKEKAKKIAPKQDPKNSNKKDSPSSKPDAGPKNPPSDSSTKREVNRKDVDSKTKSKDADSETKSKDRPETDSTTSPPPPPNVDDQKPTDKSKPSETKAKDAPPRTSTKSDESRQKQATTDLSKVDADFQLQGEYMGRLTGWWNGAERIGLQVVALGDGKFDAVMLRGGLPGAGWDSTKKVSLSGQRDGDHVARFSNDHYQIEVSSDRAVIEDRQGQLIAELTKWHRISSTQDAPPPPNAIVLFDGSSTDAFQDGRITEDGLLSIGAITKMSVGDFKLHLEFRTPYMPYARGQGRGNSGVYIQQRYEVQILDSFGLEGAENECGGLYKQKRPAVNMCLPPLSWQTYDIEFTASRWDSNGRKWAPARITVLHNGVAIHTNYELTDKTGGGKVEGPEPFPILLQNHGNPVTFRNIWIVPRNSWPSVPSDQHSVFDGGFADRAWWDSTHCWWTAGN